MEKTLLRVGEAAEVLSVSRWTVYRWIEEGKLEGTKIGPGSLRVLRESVAQLIEDNRTDPSNEGRLRMPR
ncbi:MAG: helix-turn-helix domain-containing protein [Nitrospiraceae bacterium]|jgi:excisionase family DNA binding protein